MPASFPKGTFGNSLELVSPDYLHGQLCSRGGAESNLNSGTIIGDRSAVIRELINMTNEKLGILV